MKPKYKTSIANCTIDKVTQTNIICSFNGNIGYCDMNQISDYPMKNIEMFFSTFPKYKFKIIGVNPDGSYVLSYKLAHPQLVKNKKKIIPTARHYLTLKNYVYSLLEDDDA